MKRNFHRYSLAAALVTAVLFLSACGAAATEAPMPATAEDMAVPETMEAVVSETEDPAPPAWFSTEMKDVVSGETFTINDFAGKVVLVETMATWCPTCLKQANEVKVLKEKLADREDVVLVSLDVDLNEDEDVLKNYTAQGGFDWRFAVAPLEVQRDLGNLYTAELLNPPLAPMLIIDKQGDVFGLPNGLKGAEALYKTLLSYLDQ
jgi:thiol-disulfide isomerase/thioredoxin